MTVAWKPSMAIPVVVAVTENATTSMRAKGRASAVPLPLTYVNGQAKSRSFQQSQGMNGFFYTGYRSISR